MRSDFGQSFFFYPHEMHRWSVYFSLSYSIFSVIDQKQKFVPSTTWKRGSNLDLSSIHSKIANSNVSYLYTHCTYIERYTSKVNVFHEKIRLFFRMSLILIYFTANMASCFSFILNKNIYLLDLWGFSLFVSMFFFSIFFFTPCFLFVCYWLYA